MGTEVHGLWQAGTVFSGALGSAHSSIYCYILQQGAAHVAANILQGIEPRPYRAESMSLYIFRCRTRLYSWQLLQTRIFCGSGTEEVAVKYTDQWVTQALPLAPTPFCSLRQKRDWAISWQSLLGFLMLQLLGFTRSNRKRMVVTTLLTSAGLAAI